MIYLDYAASTPLEPRAEEAMRIFARELYGNPSSLHSAGRQARAAIDAADVVDLRPRDGLTIRDDGQRLDLRAGESNGTLARDLSNERSELWVRSENPPVGDLDEGYASPQGSAL